MKRNYLQSFLVIQVLRMPRPDHNGLLIPKLAEDNSVRQAESRNNLFIARIPERNDPGAQESTPSTNGQLQASTSPPRENCSKGFQWSGKLSMAEPATAWYTDERSGVVMLETDMATVVPLLRVPAGKVNYETLFGK